MLQNLVNVAIVIFMAGNLLEVGLRLKIPEAMAALGNVRFVMFSLLWCFLAGPAVAVLLTRIIPMDQETSLGLLLLGMVPCSPAIPMMMKKSGGSLAYMSAFMVLAYSGTVVLMPFMVPWLAKGITADPWTIAKPLVFLIALPLVAGMTIHHFAERFAEKAVPVVKKVTGLNTLFLCLLLLWIYKGDLYGAIGTNAIIAQIVYYALLGFAVYLLGFGLSYDQKAPMTLGICTRNVGPAFATLMGAADVPRGAVTMCILAIVLGALLSGFTAAAILKRYCIPSGKPDIEIRSENRQHNNRENDP